MQSYLFATFVKQAYSKNGDKVCDTYQIHDDSRAHFFIFHILKEKRTNMLGLSQ